MKRKYQPLNSVIKFGEALLETNDLDPIYLMLHYGRKQGLLDDISIRRWLLVYWLFYHAGVASFITEQKPKMFYPMLFHAFDNRFPRGSERRHFRGQIPRQAISWFMVNYPQPEHAVDAVYQPTFSEVRKTAKGFPLFGDWIAFKVADMLERCLGLEVDFNDCELSFYDQPAKASVLVAPEFGVATANKSVAEITKEVVEAIAAELAPRYFAPPTFNRPINVQEIETILCKFKSHRNGTYPLCKDIEEIKHGVHGWGSLASELVKGLDQKFLG